MSAFLIEIDPVDGVWVNPSQIAAVFDSGINNTTIFLAGDHELEIRKPLSVVISRIRHRVEESQ